MGERIAIIVAGGSGVRMGAEVPKQFLSLCGRPILVRTVEKFAGLADRVVVVVPAASGFDFAGELPNGVEVCTGGATRFESVRNALTHITSTACAAGKSETHAHAGAIADAQPPANRTYDGSCASGKSETHACVAIHDGVRPLVSRGLIERAFAEAGVHGTAVPYVTPVDSFRLDGAPVDRGKLMAIQTPQVFRLDILLDGYALADEGFTDDASSVEAAGHTLHFIEGERENIKITTHSDLKTAEALCE